MNSCTSDMAKPVDVNPSIFRAYDIRGLSPKYLNEESAELIGIAYGNLLDKLAAEGKNPKVKEIVISRDHRKSGVAIKRGLIRGLRKTGKSIVDIGVNCTPAFYFALCSYRFKAGCQITASTQAQPVLSSSHLLLTKPTTSPLSSPCMTTIGCRYMEGQKALMP